MNYKVFFHFISLEINADSNIFIIANVSDFFFGELPLLSFITLEKIIRTG